MTTLRPLAALVFTLAGCVDATVPPVTGTRRDCSLAVIASDYETTGVSLLNADGTLCVDPLVHSGSGGVGLVTGLSGDVVFPSTAPTGGHVWLIDRYPNAVISVLDPASGVIVQTSVSTGFPANPQDVWRSPGTGRWYVSRASTNPSAGKRPFDGGGDVLMLDDGAAVGRIALDGLADPGFDPKPARMAAVGPLGADPTTLVVGLAHLSRNFAGGGPGRLALIDLASDRVFGQLDVPDATNCVTVLAVPGAARAVAVCSGVFAEPPRAAHSALVVLDTSLPTPTITRHFPAQDLVGAALGFGLAPLDTHRVVVLVFGDLGAGTKDRLALVDLDTGAATDLGVAGAAFELGEPVYVPSATGGSLLVPEAHAAAPRVLPFRLSLDPLTVAAAPAVDASPATGLPPRHLQLLEVTVPQ